MHIQTYLYSDNWDKPLDSSLDSKNTLIIVFGSSNVSCIKNPLDELVKTFPKSNIIGCSTAGEIYQDEIYDDTLVVSVIRFEKTHLKRFQCSLISAEDSYHEGKKIANYLYDGDLKGIFVLSDGLNINGSKLTQGLSSVISGDIPITGGLAGDGDRFENTWVLVDNEPKRSHICAIGFYGCAINFSYASKGGWDRLGMKRVVTKSRDNVVYELDNKPALEIYKRYLGKKASELPASGLLFPLELKSENSKESKVRTILSVNEEEQSITFAGDVPQNSCVTLMKANFERIIDGASIAAEELKLDNYTDEEILCIAISCVGRRLVLKSRADEEVEAVLEVLPKDTKQIGFYSYGEISPLSSGICDLHNQTMTLTLIWESDA